MDHIKELLLSTGLSPDDLIKKLAEYKSCAAAKILPNTDRVISSNEDNSLPSTSQTKDIDALSRPQCDISLNNIDNIVSSTSDVSLTSDVLNERLNVAENDIENTEICVNDNIHSDNVEKVPSSFEKIDTVPSKNQIIDNKCKNGNEDISHSNSNEELCTDDKCMDDSLKKVTSSIEDDTNVDATINDEANKDVLNEDALNDNKSNINDHKVIEDVTINNDVKLNDDQCPINVINEDIVIVNDEENKDTMKEVKYPNDDELNDNKSTINEDAVIEDKTINNEANKDVLNEEKYLNGDDLDDDRLTINEDVVSEDETINNETNEDLFNEENYVNGDGLNDDKSTINEDSLNEEKYLNGDELSDDKSTINEDTVTENKTINNEANEDAINEEKYLNGDELNDDKSPINEDAVTEDETINIESNEDALNEEQYLNDDALNKDKSTINVINEDTLIEGATINNKANKAINEKESVNNDGLNVDLNVLQKTMESEEKNASNKVDNISNKIDNYNNVGEFDKPPILKELVEIKTENCVEIIDSEKDECMEIDKNNELNTITSKRQPILGCIRKNTNKTKPTKVIRLCKTDWMALNDDPTKKRLQIHKEVTRERIFNQIQMLRSKKAVEIKALGNIINPISQKYTKRTRKIIDEGINTEQANNFMGIQILEVRGGIKEDDIDSLHKQDLVNGRNIPIAEELDDSNETPIQLKKTDDFTKIKGWKSKRFLLPPPAIEKKVKDVSGEKAKPSISFCGDSGPSCSYLHPDLIKSDDKIEVLNDLKPEISSAFASTNLNGFLEEEKKLDPSIGLFNDSVGELVPIICEEHKPETIHNTRFGYGDMKRHFTMAKNEDTNCIKQMNKTDMFKPRTLAEKRKLLRQNEQEKNLIPCKQPKQEIVVLTREESRPKHSFKSIIYSGPIKVVVPTYRRKRTYNLKHLKLDKMKPSIFDAKIKVNAIPKIKYKAGPLSKKVLQNNCALLWTSELKQLPKITLTIKTNKVIHPEIQRFVTSVYDTYEISKQRADFALSALSTNKSDEDNVHTFTIPYQNNQEQLLLRKKNDLKRIKETDEEAGLIINNVMNDLITCIENREIEATLIKDDPDFTMETGISRKIIKPIKPSRTLRELQKLSCKIVDLNIQDDDGVCTNKYCILGCVCNSLKAGIPITEDHCNEVRCIFKCVCGYERIKKYSKQINVGSESISDRTVSRLEDEAKKTLARVEAEFTQTVIQTNNQAILVDDCRKRKRRTAKIPKKYEDFMKIVLPPDNIDEESETNEEDPEIQFHERPPTPKDDLIEEEIIPLIDLDEINEEAKECRVNLINYDFSYVIPFCLEHNLYECHCKFEADYNKEFKRPMNVIITKKTAVVIPDNFKDSNASCARTRYDGQYYVSRNKTIRFKKILVRKFDLSGDTNPVVRKWNATPDYVSNEIIDLDDEESLLQPMGESSIYSDKPTNRRKQSLQIRTDTIPVVPENKLKAMQRRQYKMGQSMRNIPEKTIIKESDEDNPPVKKHKSDLLSPTGAISDKFAQLLGHNASVKSNFRLLQWSSLMGRYMTKIIEIWCTTADNKLKLIITDDGVAMPGFKNIREYETLQNKSLIKIDVIRWIVSRQIPEGKNGEDISVILNLTNSYCEICGICAKNKVAPDNKSSVSISLLQHSHKSKDKSLITQEYVQDRVKLIKIKNKIKTQTKIELMKSKIEDMKSRIESMKKPPILVQEPEQSLATIEPIHKIEEKTKQLINNANHKYKTVQQVAFAKGDFTLKKLLPTLEGKFGDEINAALPNIIGEKMCKWRMLPVNSNFSILAFKRNEFRIKCSDILTVMKVAQKYAKTIIINTEDISKNYGHNIYGIYLVPNYQDRIFIGPYYQHENHDIETLRFVNNVLVDTELFNKMRGNVNNNATGVWYRQDATLAPIAKVAVIDLTEVEDDSTPKSVDVLPKNSPRSLLKSNVVKIEASEVVVEKSAQTEDIIKGLIDMMASNFTPLPHGCYPICFGVNFSKLIIHGYKEIDQENVHIFWPGNINYQFSRPFRNGEVAKNWLRDQLMSSLICLPSKFKIIVDILMEDTYKSETFFKEWKSLSNSIFTEIGVVGSFGSIQLNDLVGYITKTPEFSLKTIMCRNDIHSTKKFKETVINATTENDQYGDYLKLIQTQIENEKFRQARLLEAKIEMRFKNYELLKVHTSLIKKVDVKLRDKIKEEFMKHYDKPIASTNNNNTNKPINKLVKEDDVICLDSDDGDDAINEGKSKDELSIKSFKKIIDPKKEHPKNVLNSELRKLEKLIEVNKHKNITINQKPDNVKSLSISSSFISVVDKEATKNNIYNIDLSHMNMKHVLGILGKRTNEKVVLTKEQVLRLNQLEVKK